MITLNNKKLCENCFSETTVEPCPHCGFIKSAYRHDPITLAVGSVLNQRYMIGGVIGKGGFGITYLAYDLKLDARLAVKEYYPMGLAMRNPGSTLVSVSNEESEESFKTGAEKFYNEAKMVAKFNGNPNIVSVHDFFYENDTVYFTMGYLQGQTLKSYLKTKKITEGQAVSIFQAISSALMASHSLNILHRDISPDNIMLCDDGTIRLLDFGAARQVMAEQSQSLSVILKQGFAPLEQYQQKGKQGPWTDIYALGATIYNALTGDMLNDPMTRLEDDSEFTGNKFGISAALWNIIEKCTRLKIQDRYQDIFELKKDLNSIGIEAETFSDIEEEITDILKGKTAKAFGSTPNYAPASDPNATMLLGGDGGGNRTMSMDENATVYLGAQGGNQQGNNTAQGQQNFNRQGQTANAGAATPKKKIPIPLVVAACVLVMAIIVGSLVSFVVKRIFSKGTEVTAVETGNTDDNGDDTNGGGDDKGSDAGERNDALKAAGISDIDTYTDSTYLYSICYPSGYTVMNADDRTVEIADSEGRLHMAVRYMSNYNIDGTVIYDAADYADLINARPDNLLPVEGSGSSPKADNAGRVDIAGQEDVVNFEYHYTDNNSNAWDGNIYLFDSQGQYGCYAVYTLLYDGADDYDKLEEYARACVDSFRIDDAYEPEEEIDIYYLDDHGIKFSLPNAEDVHKNDYDVITVEFENDGETHTAWIAPGEKFGTDYAEMFFNVADEFGSNMTITSSEMRPLNYGRYEGYWVSTTYDSDGTNVAGLMHAFSARHGSDAVYDNYLIIGAAEDSKTLYDILGGFRFDGATASDLSGVDIEDTVEITAISGGDGDVDDFVDDYVRTSEYIFPGTDSKEMSEDDVQSFLKDYIENNNARNLSESAKRTLCARALCYARNEIYARHGYIFNSSELNDLFNSMSWYEGTVPADRFNSNVFNKAEKHNIEFLKSKMDDYGGYQPAK